jgi:hypothetical protein
MIDMVKVDGAVHCNPVIPVPLYRIESVLVRNSGSSAINDNRNGITVDREVKDR